jgi:hypothetical protein
MNGLGVSRRLASPSGSGAWLESRLYLAVVLGIGVVLGTVLAHVIPNDVSSSQLTVLSFFVAVALLAGWSASASP